MQFLYGRFLGFDNYWRFREEFFEQSFYDWYPKKGALKTITKGVHAKAFVLSRKQVNLANVKLKSTRWVELPSDVREQYDEIEKAYACGELWTQWAVVKHTWMHQVAAGQPKQEELPSHAMKIKELLGKGVLGNVWSATITRKGPFPDRIRDVGVVIDLGVHDIDIMRHLFGTEIIRISAETERRIHTDHEDYLNAILRFESGVVGVMDVNWLTPVKIRQIHISGEKGMLSGDYIKQELTFYRNGNSGRVENILIEKKEPLKTEIEAFRDCVAQDRHPAVNGIDGLISLEMVLNILKAAKTKNSVKCNGNGNGKPAEQEKGE